jgi:hypothetical protein
MSNTSLSALNMLYQHITHSVLLTDAKKPNGKLCKLERPLNSVLEDIVINTLGLNKESVQEGVLNVNIYVLNLVSLTNASDKSQPDMARLLYLQNLANTALGSGEEIWEETGSYIFNIQQDQVYQDENNQHYVGFRVEFYSQNN